MDNKRIYQDTTDIIVLLDTDAFPVVRPGDQTPYHARIQYIRSLLLTSPFEIPVKSGQAIIELDTNIIGMPWKFYSWATSFLGTQDDVINIGINSYSTPAGHTDLTRAGLSIQMELAYNYGAGIDSEFHINWDSPDNTIHRRPWQINMTHATGAVYHQIKGHISFYDSSGGTTLMDIPESGATDGQRAFVIPSRDIVFGGYHAPVIYDDGDGQPKKLRIHNGVVTGVAYTYP